MKLTSATLAERIALLSWTMPLAFFVLVVLHQLGPARWVHDTYSDPVHFVAEILFYGTIGPLLTLWTLRRLGGWLDQKEQAERQARASERRLAAITSAHALEKAARSATGEALAAINEALEAVEAGNKAAVETSALPSPIPTTAPK